MLRITTIVIAGILSAEALLGHDLWLVPKSPDSHQLPGDIYVVARTGERLLESVSLLEPTRIESFYYIASDGERVDVTEPVADGEDLIAKVEASDEVLLVVAIAVRPKFFFLHADAYNEYLTHPGVPGHILEDRVAHGHTSSSGREMYTKYAKLLLPVGRPDRVQNALEPVGLEYEVVPLVDPLALSPGEALSVRVLFEGEPIAGVSVHGMRPNQDKGAGCVTSVKGECQIVIDEAGLWSLTTLHMRKHGNQATAEWESFFSTLTFYAATETAAKKRSGTEW